MYLLQFFVGLIKSFTGLFDRIPALQGIPLSDPSNIEFLTDFLKMLDYETYV